MVAVSTTPTTYTVTARRWAEGWELHIEGEGVTQVRTLDQATSQVRDYLTTVHERDFTDTEVTLVPDLDGYEKEVAAARREVAAATTAQLHAAARSRAVVKELRARGLSVTDTAAILGITRGRVSQLANHRSAS